MALVLFLKQLSDNCVPAFMFFFFKFYLDLLHFISHFYRLLPIPIYHALKLRSY